MFRSAIFEFLVNLVLWTLLFVLAILVFILLGVWY
jgi:hypothetical protein